MILQRLLYNNFMPLHLSAFTNVHMVLVLLVGMVALGQLLFVPVEVPVSDLYATASYKLLNQELPLEDLNENHFNARGHNLWVNLLYYRKYSEQLTQYFNVKNVGMPAPRFPLISVLLARLFRGVHLFPPTNFVDIVEFVRSKMGSGITIRAKGKLVGSRNVDAFTYDQCLKLFSQLKEHLQKRFEIHFQYVDAQGQSRVESYVLSYGNFPDFAKILSSLLGTNVRVVSVSFYQNYGVESLLYPKNKYSTKRLLEHYSLQTGSLKELVEVLKRFKEHMARVYTFRVLGVHDGKDVENNVIVRFDNYPYFPLFLWNMNQQGIRLARVDVIESRVLKYKPNSREWVDPESIPGIVRQAFILMEDDYFYVQAGGIDPFGLMKAAYNYVVHGERKGNASIIEQLYEMYLGQQSKGPFEKLLQIFGAIYLSAYESNRTRFANLYVQSIPGSFWRDHNYGVKSIIKNYLNKDSIKNITIRELAWLSRIALLPNTFGLDYIRFDLLQRRLQSYRVDIRKPKELWRFLESHPKASEVLRAFYTKDTSNKEVFERLQKLYRSYVLTNEHIVMALNEFAHGNEFLRPIIQQDEYERALGDTIRFHPSRFVNIYQSYTDQTRKDLIRFVGKWMMNSGLDVEVAFHEGAQEILDEELQKSTQNMYHYIREDYLTSGDRERYGGAGVLVQTHHIKTKELINHIIAVSSKHSGSSYFNWAVDGKRQFGSILKWTALLLYLDQNGTLLDTFYDIPRIFTYSKKSSDGKLREFTYRPDNWRRGDNPYGFYTFDRRDNVYNFTQSKNNTFVRISEIVGLTRFASFLNEAAEVQYVQSPRERELLTFRPILPLVLGAQDTTSVQMAQVHTVIANKGIFQPLTTIIRLIEMDGSSLFLDLSSERRRLVSREAAEAAFLCGYINTYFGTAKRFIPGGIGKTGSSNTDVAFLAMTGRTEREYIRESPHHVLNGNLLYLVNMGLDEGKVHRGLFGGTAGAINARNVFVRLLEENENGRIIKRPISGSFMDFFSGDFEYVSYNSYPTIEGQKILIPIPKNRRVFHEKDINAEEITRIHADYIEYRKSVRVDERVQEIAQAQGLDYHKLNKLEQENLRELAFLEIQNSDFFLYEDSDYQVPLREPDGEHEDAQDQEEKFLDTSGATLQLGDLASKKDKDNNSHKATKLRENMSEKAMLDQILKAEKPTQKKTQTQQDSTPPPDIGTGFAPVREHGG